MPESDNGSRALCGMTETEISEKHLRLRGSRDLRYPVLHAACTTMCGRGDNGDIGHDHRCFLFRDHAPEDHEFSSECIGQDIAELGRVSLSK